LNRFGSGEFKAEGVRASRGVRSMLGCAQFKSGFRSYSQCVLRKIVRSDVAEDRTMTDANFGGLYPHPDRWHFLEDSN
jgi:hypothetical protein